MMSHGKPAHSSSVSRWGAQGESEDDYVLGVVDRDANIGVYRVGRSGLIGPLKTSASIDAVIKFIERDAYDLGIHAAAVFQKNDNGSLTQVGNVVRGKYQESGYSSNGRATTVDDVAARELSLFIENDYALIGAPNSRGKAIHANLERKVKSGTYDPDKAPAAWQYLIDEGAKKYEREFGDSSPIFNAATRRSVATDFARAWEEQNLLSPNARRIPGYLQGYEEFSQKDFEDDLIDKGYSAQEARYQAARAAQQTGRTRYFPPRVPVGWRLRPDAIFNRRTTKPSFVAYKGGKFQVFDHSGNSLSGELRNMREYFEWCDKNGYGESASW